MHFITKATPINNIDSRCRIRKPESSIAYITGYSGFISRELFLLAWGANTHTHTYQHPHESDFKKPGERRWHAPGLKMTGPFAIRNVQFNSFTILYIKTNIPDVKYSLPKIYNL